MSAVRLVIVATHPIQYHMPWFWGLAARPGVDLTVYFGALPDPVQQGAGFGVPLQRVFPFGGVAALGGAALACRAAGEAE
jgi:hypothetical protein